MRGIGDWLIGWSVTGYRQLSPRLVLFSLVLHFGLSLPVLAQPDPPGFDELLRRGEQALRRGEVVRGRELLQEAKALQPEHPTLLVLLCEADFLQGDRAGALARAAQIGRLNIPNADLYARLGLLCGRQGELACAVAALQQASRLDPGSPQIAFNLGLAHFARHEFADTVRVLDELDPFPEDSRVYGLLGNACMALGETARAEEMLGKAVRLNPASEAASYLLGTLLANQRRYREARDLLLEAAEAVPGSARIRLILGMSQYMTGLKEEAEESFEAACRIDPEPVSVRERIAHFYQMVGETEKSLESYRAVIERGSRGAFRFYVPYADLLSQAGEREQVLAFLDRVVPELEAQAAASDSSERQMVLGELYFARGSIRQAEQMFLQVHEADPSVESAYHLGHFYDRQGNGAASQRYLREALEQDGDHVPSLVLLGSRLVDQGEYEAALDLLERAQAVQPHNLRAQFETARCLVRRQNWPAATVLLEDLIAKQPGHRQAHFFLSKAYMAAADREKARHHQEVFQRLEKEARARQTQKGAPYRTP